MKYEFRVGDYVETQGGHEGYVLKCSCFPDEFPATWYLTVYHKEYGHSTVYRVCEDRFSTFFKRIGQYDFTKSETKRIEKLPVDLVAKFEIPDGGYITLKMRNNNDELVETFYSRELVNKINELVEAVNRLEEKVNEMV